MRLSGGDNSEQLGEERIYWTSYVSTIRVLVFRVVWVSPDQGVAGVSQLFYRQAKRPRVQALKTIKWESVKGRTGHIFS